MHFPIQQDLYYNGKWCLITSRHKSCVLSSDISDIPIHVNGVPCLLSIPKYIVWIAKHILSSNFSWNRYGYQTNTLDGEQTGQTYTKKQGFKFSPVEYSFNDPVAECDNMKYICTRIDKGEMPRTMGNLPFEFSGYPDEIALTGCTEAPECQGKNSDMNMQTNSMIDT